MRIKILLIFAALILIIALLYAFIRNNNQKSVVAELSTNSIYDLVFGNSDAPVSIIMYSSYNCGYCRKFFNEVFPQIKERYINTGNVKLILKPTDLSGNELITKSLSVLVCLNQWGNTEYLHELLLLEPNVAISKRFEEVTDSFINESENMAECLLSNESTEYIKNNSTILLSNGFCGTPVFITGSKIMKGYKEFYIFEELITK